MNGARTDARSTRGYERSLDPVNDELETKGTSKSNASRALIEQTQEQLEAFLNRRLDDLDLVAMFIDGLEIAGHAIIVALGVTIDGTKEPLGSNRLANYTPARC